MDATTSSVNTNLRVDNSVYLQSKPSLLTTKLFVPASGRHIIRRPRLEERLKQGCEGALTVICAPAGFGKTTLLTDWLCHNPQPVAWVSLDASDNDPAQFLTYWITALQRGTQKFQSDIGISTLEQLQSPQPVPFESLLIDVLNDLTTTGVEMKIIFDDYHCIEHPQIHQLLTFFLDHMPPTCHMCLTTRSDPPFPLARLRSRGMLTEIRAKDLALTREEIAEFYQVLGLNMSEDNLEILRTRTEGWVAGLQLAGLSMQDQQNASDFIRQFRGTHRYIVDYLVEEVLLRQPPETQEFLLHTSVLNRLCGDLCDAVTGLATSQQMLEQLDASGFFLFALDEERQWFRYHHLLSDVLRQRLHHDQASLISEIHHKAARWCADQHFDTEALHHAFAAKNYALAANILETVAEQVWEGGSRFSLLHWFDKLPEEAFTSNPQLLLFAAKEWLYAGEMEQAEQKLAEMEDVLHTRSVDGNIAHPQNLAGRMAVMRATIAMYHGDIPTLLQYSEQALQILPEKDNVWRSMVGDLAGIAYYWDGPGNIRKAKEVFVESMRLNKAESAYFHLLHSVQYGMVEKAQGLLAQALEHYNNLLHFAEERRLAHTGLTGVILSEIGDILIEQHQIERGMEHILKGVDLSEKAGSSNIRWWTYNILAKAHLYQGDYAHAQRVVDDTMAWLTQHHMASWYMSVTQARQGQVFLWSGDLEQAVQWAEQQSLQPDDEVSHVRELQHLVYTRILIAHHCYDEALALLNRLLTMTETDTRLGSAIELHLIKAMLLHRQKQSEAAVQEVAQALLQAEAGGYITLFVQEGTLMAELMRNAVKLKTAQHSFSPDYAKRVLAAFPDISPAACAVSHPDLLDNLSDRELEVLRYLAKGFRNQEIADSLYISLNTVKTHLKHIHSKLDVNNRTEAVARGREIGLL